ncbi:hypothetical protein C0J52_24343, partial [Blattella germanica]
IQFDRVILSVCVYEEKSVIACNIKKKIEQEVVTMLPHKLGLRNKTTEEIRNAKLRHYHGMMEPGTNPTLLWQDLRTIGLMKPRSQLENITFSLETLNDHFTSVQTSTINETLKQQTIDELLNKPLPIGEQFHFTYITCDDTLDVPEVHTRVLQSEGKLDFDDNRKAIRPTLLLSRRFLERVKLKGVGRSTANSGILKEFGTYRDSVDLKIKTLKYYVRILHGNQSLIKAACYREQRRLGAQNCWLGVLQKGLDEIGMGFILHEGEVVRKNVWRKVKKRLIDINRQEIEGDAGKI